MRLFLPTNYVNEELNHPRKDNIREFARGDVNMRIGENSYSAKVIVGFTGNDMVLYDVVDLKPTNSDKTQDPAKAKTQSENTFEAAESLIETSVSTISIAENSEKSTVSEKK